MEWIFPHYTESITSEYWNDLAKRYNWISDMTETIQDSIHHAEGNVAIHTQMVLKELLNDVDYQALNTQDKHILFAAVMFHDVEKRSTTLVDENGRVTAIGHSKRGEKTTRLILYKDIPTPFVIREHICNLVRLHGLPIWAIDNDDPNKAVIDSSLRVNNKMLEILARCDVKGRICDDKDDLLERIELFKELCIDNKCYGQPRVFETNRSRYNYLNNGGSPDYVPFEKDSFIVYLMSGVAGSGKDTWISRNLNNVPIISLDDIRREMKIKPGDKKGNGQVIQLAKEKAKEYLRVKTSFVWNGTNITKQLRAQLIELFMTYSADVEIVYIETNYTNLLKQNSSRVYELPKNAIEKMILKREVPTYSEATNIRYVVW